MIFLINDKLATHVRVILRLKVLNPERSLSWLSILLEGLRRLSRQRAIRGEGTLYSIGPFKHIWSVYDIRYRFICAHLLTQICLNIQHRLRQHMRAFPYRLGLSRASYWILSRHAHDVVSVEGRYVFRKKVYKLLVCLIEELFACFCLVRSHEKNNLGLDLFGAKVDDYLVVDARAVQLKICKSCFPKVVVCIALANFGPLPDKSQAIVEA